MDLRTDANTIVQAALKAAMPDTAVRRALQDFTCPQGKLVLVAAGKAAWQMAKAAADLLGGRIHDGIVITNTATAGVPFPPWKFTRPGTRFPTGIPSLPPSGPSKRCRI